MDEEEVTIYDCNMSLESEIYEDRYDEMPDVLKYSHECSIQTFEKDAVKTSKKESKPWSGNVVKGVPTLYQLALDALPPKTRMQLSKLVLPDTTRS
jgi:hypothetical protein